uniref:PPIase FKBP-type domain-containing protein n=1 Tax=Chromera velia CCMP2878 TaxID=1169474 RepID=A0A0G4F456_9ALVE|eukprot:Cvel_14928.t1-p1 / transcript=Cvel_14928.t1 / gene=Cvel_14928 / organism=Chromera_velia_CCMP2878 / gene_product=FK506-binding protein 1, putative / transcript_product=FK506-binding protein 1, putative / location=Cvel_scaffold1082:54857-56122(+) / protein_length=422 / sequence_SO=supercontig / SO=protein_coding / is_pseudo=false
MTTTVFQVLRLAPLLVQLVELGGAFFIPSDSSLTARKHPPRIRQTRLLPSHGLTGLADAVEEIAAPRRDSIVLEDDMIGGETGVELLRTVSGQSGDFFPITTDGGVMKRVLVQGEGPLSDIEGSVATVEYSGSVVGEDGEADEVFATASRMNARVGDSSYVKGWEIALKSMQMGEKAEFILSPKYGYGVKGVPPVIGPRKKLRFIIQIKGLTAPRRAMSSMQMDIELSSIGSELEERAAARAMEIAEARKKKGENEEEEELNLVQTIAQGLWKTAEVMWDEVTNPDLGRPRSMPVFTTPVLLVLFTIFGVWLGKALIDAGFFKLKGTEFMPQDQTIGGEDLDVLERVSKLGQNFAESGKKADLPPLPAPKPQDPATEALSNLLGVPVPSQREFSIPSEEAQKILDDPYYVPLRDLPQRGVRR